MGDFDKILKENIEKMILAVAAKYMGINIKKISKLKEKLQLTEREVDFLAKVTNTDGKVFLLHIEFQTRNDPQMLRRIEEYHGFLRGKYDLEIEHFVIYLGQGKASMKTTLPEHLVFKGFHLINLSKINPDNMIASDIPEEVLLAVLGQYRKEQSETVVKRIITKLKDLSTDEKELKKYVMHLTILSRLRNFEEETTKIFHAMPITYDVKKDFLFQMGKDEGVVEGVAKGIEQGIEQGVARGREETKDTVIISLVLNFPNWSNKKIAALVGTTITRVAAIKKVHQPKKPKPIKKP
jgi:hypothetical protein